MRNPLPALFTVVSANGSEKKSRVTQYIDAMGKQLLFEIRNDENLPERKFLNALVGHSTRVAAILVRRGLATRDRARRTHIYIHHKKLSNRIHGKIGNGYGKSIPYTGLDNAKI